MLTFRSGGSKSHSGAQPARKGNVCLDESNRWEQARPLDIHPLCGVTGKSLIKARSCSHELMLIQHVLILFVLWSTMAASDSRSHDTIKIKPIT